MLTCSKNTPLRLGFSGRSVTYSDRNGFGSWPADCQVRNERNAERPLHDPNQVVHAETGNRYDRAPYMPREFPEGLWTVGSPRAKAVEDTYLWPWYIPTDAWQEVVVWALDPAGGYDYPTMDRVIDTAYGLHYHPGRTTLGCIHLLQELDVRELAQRVQAALGRSCEITIEVKYGS